MPSGTKTAADGFSPSAALLKAIAIGGSFPIQSIRSIQNNYLVQESAGTPPDNQQGFGRVRLNRVLYFADEDSTAHVTFMPRGPNRADPVLSQSNHTHTYTFCVSYLYTLWPPRFTLVWTDAPQIAGTSPTIIQDLDLTVTLSTSPAATIYGTLATVDGGSGRQRRLTCWAANGGTGYDRVNTVERVVLDSNVQPGVEITVTVSGANLPVQMPGYPSSTQPYALVATGRIVQTTCAQEFPGGVIPPGRLVDQSLIEQQKIAAQHSPPPLPNTFLGHLKALDFSDIRVTLVVVGVGLFLLGIIACLYCAIAYDDSCCGTRSPGGGDGDAGSAIDEYRMADGQRPVVHLGNPGSKRQIAGYESASLGSGPPAGHARQLSSGVSIPAQRHNPAASPLPLPGAPPGASGAASNRPAW